jgi:hypothetical protein
MSSDIADDPPVGRALADGWAEFAERVLPSVRAPSMRRPTLPSTLALGYVLQIAQQVIAQ